MKVSKIIASILVFVVLAVSFASCSNKSDTVSLNKSDVILKIGDETTLEILDDGITVVDGIGWSSSNTKVATVTNGKVVAKSVGECSVTATYKDGEYVCNISVVKEDIYAFELSETTVEKGKERQLNLYKNGEICEVVAEWSSEDNAVATVENGVVKAVGEGKTKIFAKIGSRTFECTVNVVKEFAGDFEAKVNAMGKTMIFRLSFGNDGNFVYTRVDEENEITRGKYTVNYDSKTVNLTYDGDKHLKLKYIDYNNIESIGKMITGGMEAELQFERKTA